MNKSKYLLLSGLAVALTLGGLPLDVSAIYHTPPPADTRQGIRDARIETTQTRIREFGDRLELRLTAALNRADNLRQRVEARVKMFQNPKFDQTLVTQKLKEASEAIAAGRQAVTTIQAEVNKALAAANLNTAFAALRKTIRQIIASVRTAHQKVVEVIKIIKSAYPTPPVGGPAPTTTPPAPQSP